MDIGNISGYNDIYANAASQQASRLESQLKSDYSQSTEEELMDACKQFEAYFLEQMFKEMVKTIPTSEGSSASTSNMLDYYKEQMIQKIAEDSTEQNSLGLAQMLFEQMKRNYGIGDNISNADSVAGAQNVTDRSADRQKSAVNAVD